MNVGPRVDHGGLVLLVFLKGDGRVLKLDIQYLIV